MFAFKNKTKNKPFVNNIGLQSVVSKQGLGLESTRVQFIKVLDLTTRLVVFKTKVNT